MMYEVTDIKYAKEFCFRIHWRYFLLQPAAEIVQIYIGIKLSRVRFSIGDLTLTAQLYLGYFPRKISPLQIR